MRSLPSGLAVIAVAIMLNTKTMSQFMSDRKCGRQTCVFINVAATVCLAHARHVGKTKGFTWAVHRGTDVSSGKKNSHVMV